MHRPATQRQVLGAACCSHAAAHQPAEMTADTSAGGDTAAPGQGGRTADSTMLTTLDQVIAHVRALGHFLENPAGCSISCESNFLAGGRFGDLTMVLCSQCERDWGTRDLPHGDCQHTPPHGDWFYSQGCAALQVEVAARHAAGR